MIAWVTIGVTTTTYPITNLIKHVPCGIFSDIPFGLVFSLFINGHCSLLGDFHGRGVCKDFRFLKSIKQGRLSNNWNWPQKKVSGFWS